MGGRRCALLRRCGSDVLRLRTVGRNMVVVRSFVTIELAVVLGTKGWGGWRLLYAFEKA